MSKYSIQDSYNATALSCGYCKGLVRVEITVTKVKRKPPQGAIDLNLYDEHTLMTETCTKCGSTYEINQSHQHWKNMSRCETCRGYMWRSETCHGAGSPGLAVGVPSSDRGAGYVGYYYTGCTNCVNCGICNEPLAAPDFKIVLFSFRVDGIADEGRVVFHDHCYEKSADHAEVILDKMHGELLARATQRQRDIDLKKAKIQAQEVAETEQKRQAEIKAGKCLNCGNLLGIVDRLLGRLTHREGKCRFRPTKYK